MVLLLKATKTSLVKLLRSRGYSIPTIHEVLFEAFRAKCDRGFWAHWRDADNGLHHAHLYTCCGRPVIMVDGTLQWLTMAEVIKFGLIEEKK